MGGAGHSGRAIERHLPAVRQAYARSGGARWEVSAEAFGNAVAISVAKRFDGAAPDDAALDAFIAGLHAEDLALCCACASGNSAAWDHFVLTLRPELYRAARAMTDDATGRELADSLYADLFGLGEGDGRRSLLAYYHGRSKLSTWLRTVLAQRHVDLIRAQRRLTSLDDPDHPHHEAAAPPPRAEPDQRHRMQVAAAAVSTAIAGLEAQDRLRLSYYYVHALTLAQTGRMFGEHEATASRKLERARKALRQRIETAVRAAGVRPEQIDDWGAVARDAWDAALSDALGVAPPQPAPQAETPVSFKGKSTR